MPRRYRRCLGAAGITLALTLAACGGSGSNNGSDAPRFGSEEFGLTLKELVAKAEAVEKLIGECMTEAGFEYVPNDFDTIRRAMTSDKSAPGLSESEFRSEFGYGITTQFPKPIVTLGLGEENGRIRDALPPADQVAYDRTLLGDDPEAVFAYALEAEDFSRTGGCTRTAVEQQFTRKELTTTYLNPGDQLIEQDRRVLSALDDFAACMRDAGYDYGHPDEVESDLLARLDAVTGGQDPETLTDSAAAALSELQDYERAVAPVAFECESTLLQPVVDAVEEEIYGSLQP